MSFTVYSMHPAVILSYIVIPSSLCLLFALSICFYSFISNLSSSLIDCIIEPSFLIQCDDLCLLSGISSLLTLNIIWFMSFAILFYLSLLLSFLFFFLSLSPPSFLGLYLLFFFLVNRLYCFIIILWWTFFFHLVNKSLQQWVLLSSFL